MNTHKDKGEETISLTEYRSVLRVFRTWFEAYFDEKYGDMVRPTGFQLFSRLWSIGRANKDGITDEDLEFVKKIR